MNCVVWSRHSSASLANRYLRNMICYSARPSRIIRSREFGWLLLPCSGGSRGMRHGATWVLPWNGQGHIFDPRGHTLSSGRAISKRFREIFVNSRGTLCFKKAYSENPVLAPQLVCPGLGTASVWLCDCCAFFITFNLQRARPQWACGSWDVCCEGAKKSYTWGVLP